MKQGPAARMLASLCLLFSLPLVITDSSTTPNPTTATHPSVSPTSSQPPMVQNSSFDQLQPSQTMTAHPSVAPTSSQLLVAQNSSFDQLQPSQTMTAHLSVSPASSQLPMAQNSSFGELQPSQTMTAHLSVSPASSQLPMTQNSSFDQLQPSQTMTAHPSVSQTSSQLPMAQNSSFDQLQPSQTMTAHLSVSQTSKIQPTRISSTPSLEHRPTSSIPLAVSTKIPSPSKTMTTPLTSSSISPPVVYYKYTVKFTVVSITATEDNKDNYEILWLLINECQPSYVEEGSPYFIAFQKYIVKIICNTYENDCSVTVKKLECGSLKPELQVTTTKNSTVPVEQMITEGSVGDLVTNKTSFAAQFEGSAATKPTEPTKGPKYEPRVYIIATLGYTWREFCGVVEKHFKERIAERSYNLAGERIKPDQIVIINNENCNNPTDDNEDIDVKFIVIDKEQDKVTEQVGEDLIDLLDSGQTRKLGNLFEDKLIKVRLGGVAAPSKSGWSDSSKIWLAVGVIIGIILIFLFLYLCCCRKREKEVDAERSPNYFAMDNIDSSTKPSTALENQGFDDLEEGPNRLSTFKRENGNFPVTKSEAAGVSAGPSKDTTKAPLSAEDYSDDELDMTVKDVAIEDDDQSKLGGAPTPAGTLPIIPPDPAHMAIEEAPKFLKEAKNEAKREKEYEDLDKTVTDPKIYPHKTVEKNRSPALAPNSQTRVKLLEENDYINANYVKDHHGNINFIATQHPLSNTMRDFWTMIWQENVCVIVMVNEKEKDMENYHNYWLDHKNSLTIYGHMQVRTEHMESKHGYNVTRFILQNSQKRDVTKTVIHFRFTDWDSERISDAKNFANFVRDVERTRLENTKSPVVVHCSEGQSFTGVFVAVDIGLRVYSESDKKSTVKVFDCVEKMRKDRNLIVCTKDLYNFIYKVLSILIQAKETADSKL